MGAEDYSAHDRPFLIKPDDMRDELLSEAVRRIEHATDNVDWSETDLAIELYILFRDSLMNR